MTTRTNLGRPWWMINGATEPVGNIWTDRLFMEWIRLNGPEEDVDDAGEDKEQKQAD
jgi:hypothetical protein